jgi:1-phosphatidylinositol-3-phosphate 5-kinase
MRRIRGEGTFIVASHVKLRSQNDEGLSRDYWMDDELCKECYDCKSVFTAWRRKHHCRICGTFLLLHQRSSAHAVRT